MPATSSNKEVTLFYLGGLPEGALVSAMGKSYRLPPPGEYLKVPNHAARALIRRNRDAKQHSAFTTDQAFAKAFMSMKNNIQIAAPQKQYSREQLLEMLNDLEDDIQEDIKVSKRAVKTKEEGV